MPEHIQRRATRQRDDFAGSFGTGRIYARAASRKPCGAKAPRRLPFLPLAEIRSRQTRHLFLRQTLTFRHREKRVSALQPVRGTRDIWPDEMRRFRTVIETARGLAERYGYLEMSTPVFEFTEVFKRTLGDTSDVVTKEMYTFSPRGDEDITLRPEATAASPARSCQPAWCSRFRSRFSITGRCFATNGRRRGRYRQFHQIDVELLGVAEPAADIEIVALGAHVLSELGLGDSTRLELNTLGDPASRQAYRETLITYFKDHYDDLSEESRDRLTRNPLRILDSKDRGDRKLVEGAPLFADALNQESQDFFAAVREGLDDLGIAYQLSPRLVRGLDYYTHTAFEFKNRSARRAGHRARRRPL